MFLLVEGCIAEHTNVRFQNYLVRSKLTNLDSIFDTIHQ